MTKNHSSLIKSEFAVQAGRFSDRTLTLAREDYLRWMVEKLPLSPAYRVLDVAVGTGHLSRAIAPHVREVVAVDLTPQMLAEARRESEHAGLRNV